MPPSIKEGRVTKTSQPRTRSQLSKRGQGKEENPRKTLPLVERTNKLPLDQFISCYLPPSALEIKPTDSTTDHNDPGAKEEQDYMLDIYTANSLPPTDFEACFNLIELTSSKDYIGSSIGWSPSKKRKEMQLPDMRYLILRARNNASVGMGDIQTPDTVKSLNLREISGFLSFMVTYEDGKEVIYCYEIHLSPTAQGQGLGKLLMSRFEEVGRRISLEKAMLTVFKSNVKARRFYERLGYSVDECSPQPRILRNGTVKEPDYLILSKPLNDAAPDIQQQEQT